MPKQPQLARTTPRRAPPPCASYSASQLSIYNRWQSARALEYPDTSTPAACANWPSHRKP
eukprot:8378233-Pyramimonas_sp.AAC.1